ncbi:Disulfide bond formation protein D [bacterium HR35]|nr:Disulfide bond formation protein D [bacterium HR35]
MEEKTDKNLANYLYLAGLIAVLTIGFYFLGKNVSVLKNRPEKNQGTSSIVQEVNFNVNLGSLPPWGYEAAPIKIVEFGDFHCPFCALASNFLYPALEKYIKEEKVVFYFRDFPLTQIHPLALNVHLASRCADEQGKYWEFHKEIYKEVYSKVQENLPYFNTGEENYLVGLAEKLNLNKSKFEECFKNKKYESMVNKDISEGDGYGVNGTPTFFIIKNGKTYKIEGFVPQILSEFINLIEK